MFVFLCFEEIGKEMLQSNFSNAKLICGLVACMQHNQVLLRMVSLNSASKGHCVFQHIKSLMIYQCITYIMKDWTEKSLKLISLELLSVRGILITTQVESFCFGTSSFTNLHISTLSYLTFPSTRSRYFISINKKFDVKFA